MATQKQELENDLNEYIQKVVDFCSENTPKWLTTNSYYVGVVPGHNLDLLQISFDFRIDRTTILLSETPDFLKDPEKPELKVVT